jgi:siroheme synthase
MIIGMNMQLKMFELMKPKMGYKIFFEREKKPYTVRACDDRFFICTKPFNPKKTVQYTIVDLKQFIRGTENLIFCMGFESDEDCQEALVRLQTGETEVSHRNRIILDAVRIQKPTN